MQAGVVISLSTGKVYEMMNFIAIVLKDDIPFRTQPSQPVEPREPTWSSRDEVRIIDKLLQKQAIEVCSETVGQFVSSYFLVPKTNGSGQVILFIPTLSSLEVKKLKTPFHFHKLNLGFLLYSNINF